MKDYKLSDIKRVCEKCNDDYDSPFCNDCPLISVCSTIVQCSPFKWDIDEEVKDER